MFHCEVQKLTKAHLNEVLHCITYDSIKNLIIIVNSKVVRWSPKSQFQLTSEGFVCFIIY